MTKQNDYQWFLSADLNKFRGKHIAILSKKIIASGNNAKEVWTRAHRKHPDKEFLMAKIPEDDVLIL